MQIYLAQTRLTFCFKLIVNRFTKISEIKKLIFSHNPTVIPERLIQSAEQSLRAEGILFDREAFINILNRKK